MPEYIYENEVDGVAYDRVYTIPHASIDSKIDADSESDFVAKTKAKTYGELWDHSAEMSAKRAEQHGGKDPVKQEFFEKNASKRGGKKHVDDR